MFADRINIEANLHTQQLANQPQSAFLLVSVGSNLPPQQTTLEWLYQQMFQQAQLANQQSVARELFAIMN